MNWLRKLFPKYYARRDAKREAFRKELLENENLIQAFREEHDAYISKFNPETGKPMQWEFYVYMDARYDPQTGNIISGGKKVGVRYLIPDDMNCREVPWWRYDIKTKTANPTGMVHKKMW